MNFVLRVGGEAGWGIATTSQVWAKVGMLLGYHIFESKDYASQIKGGHNYHTVRFSEQAVAAHGEKIDCLLAFDQTTYERHQKSVSSSGLILVDEKVKTNSASPTKNILVLSLAQIEKKLNQKNLHNVVFLGAVTKSLGIEFSVLEQALHEFMGKKEELLIHLLEGAKEGFQAATKNCELKKLFSLNQNLKFLSGNDAITEGALKSGITFHAQYPMTPVSAILHNLAEEATKNKKLVVVQPEDEIAALNFALGASYAGARAMTATSGGGFALMVEALGLAGMAEVPVVIVLGQRPGPSTGLPTKTEQSDLKFALSAGTGDFPRVVLAPGDMEESYTETKRAFYLAEKYQLPVIIITDKHLAESFKSVNLAEEEKKFVWDYSLRLNVTENVSENQRNKEGLYLRYAAGNLQRTLPGNPQGIYTCAGDEHNEVGEITEDPLIRKQMMERRMKKLELVRKELPTLEVLGSKNAEMTVVGWGSPQGATLEAISKLNQEGKKINCLWIKYLLPFPQEVQKILSEAKKIVLVENNYSGQLGELIAEKTGILIKDKILRYDGYTFSVDELYGELQKKWSK